MIVFSLPQKKKPSIFHILNPDWQPMKTETREMYLQLSKPSPSWIKMFHGYYLCLPAYNILPISILCTCIFILSFCSPRSRIFIITANHMISKAKSSAIIFFVSASGRTEHIKDAWFPKINGVGCFLHGVTHWTYNELPTRKSENPDLFNDSFTIYKWVPDKVAFGSVIYSSRKFE